MARGTPLATHRAVCMTVALLMLGGAAACGPTKDPWPKAAPDRQAQEDLNTKDITSALPTVADGPTVTDLAAECGDIFAGKLINLDAEDRSVRSLLTAVAAHGGIALILDASHDEKVSVKLHEVPLREAIEALAKAGGMHSELRDCAIHIVSDDPY